MISGLLLNACVVAMQTLPRARFIWRETLGHSLLEVCCALIAGGIAYCLWVQYSVSTKRMYLLGTIACAGMTFGGLVHALTSAAAFGNWRSLDTVGYYYSFGWQVAAGVLLVAAARTEATDAKPNCRKVGIRWIAGALLLSVALTALVEAIARSPVRAEDVFAPQFVDLARFILRSAVSKLAPAVSIILVLVWGLAMFVRGYIQDESALSDGLARCLVIAIAAGTAALLSKHTYDLSWWVWHIFTVLALLVLLIELARQFGASYADAQSRIEHLEAVHRISSQLGTTLDLRVVLLVLVSDIADMLRARFASVMMVDDAGETLKTMATHGLPESPLKVNEPQKIEGDGRGGFYSGHTARAFREKRVCVVDDVFTDVEFVPWMTLARCNGYAVSAPLVYQDVALGVMNLFFDAHVPLNDERIRLFETLASAAAVSIANAQLYDRALEAHPSETDAAEFFRLRLAS